MKWEVILKPSGKFDVRWYADTKDDSRTGVYGEMTLDAALDCVRLQYEHREWNPLEEKNENVVSDQH